MSYVDNLQDTSYDHSTVPVDARVRDLWVDGTLHATIPIPPSLPNQGFCMTYSRTYNTSTTVFINPVIYPTTATFGYNIGSMYNTATGTVTIPSSGIWLLSSSMEFNNSATSTIRDYSTPFYINGGPSFFNGVGTTLDTLPLEFGVQSFSRLLQLNANDTIYQALSLVTNGSSGATGTLTLTWGMHRIA